MVCLLSRIWKQTTIMDLHVTKKKYSDIVTNYSNGFAHYQKNIKYSDVVNGSHHMQWMINTCLQNWLDITHVIQICHYRFRKIPHFSPKYVILNIRKCLIWMINTCSQSWLKITHDTQICRHRLIFICVNTVSTFHLCIHSPSSLENNIFMREVFLLWKYTLEQFW